MLQIFIPDVPGPVKNLKVVDTADGEVSLAWEEPENDGGSKVISYVVERRDVKRKTWTLATDHSESPEYTVTGLQKDSFYFFRVSARNRVGNGPFVETDEAVQAKNKFGRVNFEHTLLLLLMINTINNLNWALKDTYYTFYMFLYFYLDFYCF